MRKSPHNHPPPNPKRTLNNYFLIPYGLNYKINKIDPSIIKKVFYVQYTVCVTLKTSLGAAIIAFRKANGIR